MAIERRPIRDLKLGSCYPVPHSMAIFGYHGTGWGPSFVGEETLSPIRLFQKGGYHMI